MKSVLAVSKLTKHWGDPERAAHFIGHNKKHLLCELPQLYRWCLHSVLHLCAMAHCHGNSWAQLSQSFRVSSSSGYRTQCVVLKFKVPLFVPQKLLWLNVNKASCLGDCPFYSRGLREPESICMTAACISWGVQLLNFNKAPLCCILSPLATKISLFFTQCMSLTAFYYRPLPPYNTFLSR